MITYYFDNTPNSNGRNVVHRRTCKHIPPLISITNIGIFSNCIEAINCAKSTHAHKEFDGCIYCCDLCHKGQNY